MLTQDMIDKAMMGDESALSDICRHYSEYIKTICTEYIKTPYGGKTKATDTEMEGEITTHLMIQILGLGDEKWKKYF